VAVGEAVENVGFTGVAFVEEEGAVLWRATVRNYGAARAERSWSIRTAAGAGEPRSFTIEPGAIATLQASFPADAANVRIVLSPDRFALDDVLPLVRPRPKTLSLFASTSPAFESLSARLSK